MKQYYECHVTMLGKSLELKPIVESTGWIFSCIENDICLGEGVKCYATMHYSHSKHTTAQVVENVHTVAQNLRSLGVDVIREKVELVIYDSRSDACKKEKEAYKPKPESNSNKIKDNEKLLKIFEWFSKTDRYTMDCMSVWGMHLCTDRSEKDDFELTKNHAYDESLRIEFMVDGEKYTIAYQELLDCFIDGDYIDIDGLEIVRHIRDDYILGGYKVSRRESEMRKS